MNITNNIYLDYQATTPVDKRVIDKMIPYFGEIYGNPHSRNHSFGWEAEQAVEVARENVANIIGANPKEIIFTSGATESNNLAIKGLADFYGDKKNHIITCVTEHKCVLESCRLLSERGFEVTYLQVNKDGLIDIKDLESKINDKTLLVSIMGVHNEIGVIQPLKEIGEICRKNSVFFHTDCAQAIGKIKINVDEMNIDLLSISGHKIYAPKGVGALYVRRKPRVRISAMMSGGGQERGMRSGTLATHQIVGMGEAFRIANKEMKKDHEKISKYHKKFLEKVKEIDHVYINGDLKNKVPNILNVSFNFVEGESLIMGLKDIAVSSGSACTSASLEPSYVLRALGRKDELAHSSIRFAIGRFTTEEEVEYTIDLVRDSVEKLRTLSPLWDMYKDGVDLDTIEWAEG